MVAGTYANAGKTGLGDFTQADDDVAGLVAKAASQTSPVMQQARQTGLDTANSRGLLNSSVAVGAAEGEAYKVAVPIGTAQAQIGAGKNLSNQNFEQTNETAAEGNQSQERIATGAQQTQRDIATAGNAMQERIAAENRSLQERINTTNNAAEKERLQAQLASNQDISDRDAANKLILQQMQTDSTQLIAKMNVTSNQQDKAQSAALTASNIYAGMVNNINSNTSIPADARAALLQNAKSELIANIGLTEQLYNVDLNWSFDAAPAVGGGTPTSPSQANVSANYADPGTGLGGTSPNSEEGYGVVASQDAGGNQYDRFGNYVGTV